MLQEIPSKDSTNIPGSIASDHCGDDFAVVRVRVSKLQKSELKLKAMRNMAAYLLAHSQMVGQEPV